MAYRIKQFDGLVLTDITMLPANGGNDMGSGDALTSFTQLPGGGYFDNYGSQDSPQGIRPITRNCVLWGDSDAELVANLKALRGKIGRRGKLTIEFDTGELWWQWARLQRCHMPRPREAVGNYLPCNLSFVTAAQSWYGIRQSGESWSVGDDSMYLGDGTVSLGMNDYTYDLDFPNDSLTATLPNGGNTFVRNMQIIVTGDENLDALDIRCTQTGHKLEWSDLSVTGAWTLTIDTGAKSCLLRDDSSGVTISSIISIGAIASVGTSGAHGLTTGDSVEIVGTTYFDGVYNDITVSHSSAFNISVDPEVVRANESAGTAYPISDSWSNLTVRDRKNWFLLAPGNNEVVVNSLGTAGTQLQDYSIQFRWYDHYK